MLVALVSAGTVAQQSLTLANVIKTGVSGNTYTISDDLVGVYAPVNYSNVLFAKDDNGYERKSAPTEGQQIYDVPEDFDQSNWVKIVFPEGIDVSQYVGMKIVGGTITGVANVEEVPCKPLGLTITLNGTALPTVGSAAPYVENKYIAPNFVKQEEWFFVKPQNLEYATVEWAVYHSADKKFYVPKKTKYENTYGFKGSFPVDMSLWELDPSNPDPNTIFEDGVAYVIPAIIEFNTGNTVSLRIDPGFDEEGFIELTPRRASSTFEIGEGGEAPDGYRNIMVYPLRMESVLSGLDETGVAKQAVATTYVNLAGMQSEQAFDGVNIVITRYSDGSTTTHKTMKY